MPASARVRFNERVEELVIECGKVVSVRQTRVFTPDVVINAAGPWGAEVAKMAGLDVPSRIARAAITEPVAASSIR